TYDHIQIANYTIERTWYAGRVEIIPECNVQQNGDTINYCLKFNVQCNLAKPPSWIFENMSENITVEKCWFNFLNTVELAYSLYKASNYNLTEYDYEVSLLTFYCGENTTRYYEMYNESLTLFSVFSPWNVTTGVLNMTKIGAWNSTWVYVMGSQLVNTSFYGLFGSENSSWLIYDPDVVYAAYFDEPPIGFQFTQYPQDNTTPPIVILCPFPTEIIVKCGIYYYNPLPYATFFYTEHDVNLEYYYNALLEKTFQL
ncbi:MAG: hypothetical protein RXR43_11735, partial [Sulfolobus sp.]